MMTYLEDHPKTDHHFRSVFGQINPVSTKMLWRVQHLLYTNLQKEVRKRVPNIDMFIPSPNENGISSKNHGWTWCPFHTGWLINHINPVPTTLIPTLQTPGSVLCWFILFGVVKIVLWMWPGVADHYTISFCILLLYTHWNVIAYHFPSMIITVGRYTRVKAFNRSIMQLSYIVLLDSYCMPFWLNQNTYINIIIPTYCSWINCIYSMMILLHTNVFTRLFHLIYIHAEYHSSGVSQEE